MLPRTPLAQVAPGAAAPLAAQPLAPARPDPRAPLFVDVSWLAQHLHDANLVLLHVGDGAAYPGAHIEGARLVSVADVSVGDRNGPGLAVEMPSPDTLRARLASLGISDGSRVVLYYAKDMVYQTTRIAFTLAYAGLGERTSVLDGGMGAWVAAGHPASSDSVPRRTGNLSPLSIRNFIVQAGDVQKMIGAPNVSIIDARDTAFFGGSKQGGSAQAPHRAGHIPSARSVPWSMLVDADGRIQPADALRRAFSAAGVKDKDLVVAYCHTGQQATAVLTAARSLGHPVLLYDGAFQDWSARIELPVETGAAQKVP